MISYSIISNMIDNLVPIKTWEDAEAIAGAYRQEIYLTNLLVHTVQGTVSMFRNIVVFAGCFPHKL